MPPFHRLRDLSKSLLTKKYKKGMLFWIAGPGKGSANEQAVHPFSICAGLAAGRLSRPDHAYAGVDGRVAGGIAGANLGTIQNTSVSGNVRGVDSVGGLGGN